MQPLRRQVLSSRPRLLSAVTNPHTHHHQATFSSSAPRLSFWSDLTSSFKSKSTSKSQPTPKPQPLPEIAPSAPSSLSGTTKIKTTKTDTDSVKITASSSGAEESSKVKGKRKTVAEQDAELLAKLEGISGEGGASGVEYEDGKASGLKRGVKDNMFRVI